MAYNPSCAGAVFVRATVRKPAIFYTHTHKLVGEKTTPQRA